MYSIRQKDCYNIATTAIKQKTIKICEKCIDNFKGICYYHINKKKEKQINTSDGTVNDPKDLEVQSENTLSIKSEEREGKIPPENYIYKSINSNNDA